MVRRNVAPVWAGIIGLSCIFLMGQDSDWAPGPDFDLSGRWQFSVSWKPDPMGATVTQIGNYLTVVLDVSPDNTDSGIVDGYNVSIGLGAHDDYGNPIIINLTGTISEGGDSMGGDAYCDELGGDIGTWSAVRET